MLTIAFWQAAATPGWVGPTMAISLAVLALVAVGALIVVAYAARRAAEQAERIAETAASLRGDVVRTLGAVRGVTEQTQELLVLARQEAGAFATTGRRLRRRVVRGADRIQHKLEDLETLYDVVHAEVEESALTLATTLRTFRQGGGMIGRVRRLLVPGR